MAEEELSFKMVFDGTQRSDILSYTVTSGITKTLNYHFKLTATNFVGTSAFSPVLTSLAAVVPSVPQDFEITGSALGSVSLAWAAPLQDGGSPLTGYYIYFRLFGSGSVWSKTDFLSEEFNSYEVIGLTPNLKYSFKIVGVNVKGESEQSGVLYQYSGALASSLQQPTLIAGTRTWTTVGI